MKPYPGNSMAIVRTILLDAGTVPDTSLTYAVIGARESGRWIFVRHRDRSTWEMPAGHIETGESALEAARRELYEETGTVKASMEGICDYEVFAGGRKEYGRLFLAEVAERDPLPGYEIADIILSPSLPGELTYPEVQSVLFDRVKSGS